MESKVPKKLAYLIHNAFHVIKLHGVKDYESLPSKFRVKSTATSVKLIRIVSAAEILPSSYEFTDKKDSLAIVSAAIGLKGSVKTLIFKGPFDTLTEQEVTEWGNSNGYVVGVDGDSITLTEK